MSRIRSWIVKEEERWLLWLPVAFAAGIALYYALPSEPSARGPWRLLAGSLVFFAATFSHRVRYLRPFAYGFIALASGFFLANIHTERHAQPVIYASVKPKPLEGTVEEIERTEHGVRFTLSDVVIEGFEAKDTPARVRLSVRPKKGAALTFPHIGDRISIMAGLMPPMGPALPNGFDFARYFFFRDIGAVGYGLPPWQVIAPDRAPTATERFMDWRFALTDRIINRLGAERGPIAAGLITGEARAITETDFDALKASNLYHIIAISGGHMVVIAGVIFVALRLLLLILPGGFAQRPRGKSTAAFITLLLVTVYLAITGMPISAVRAYVMIALVLIAVMLGRRGDPMRALMLTFFLMLLIDPSDLFEPGFQLSFAATLAIVAIAEALWFRAPLRVESNILGNIWRLFFASLVITVVAQLATTPLAIAMFNTVSTYGLAANMLATPLVSFFLMPTVVLFFLLLPLGLENIALAAMDWGIRGLLWIAHSAAGIPGAQLFVPSLPAWGLGLFAGGLLWVCLWQTRVRFLGLLLVVIGSLSFFTVSLPDVLIGPEGKQVVIKSTHGYMQVKGRANAMIPELWAQGLGEGTLERKDDSHWRCDAAGCIATVGTTRIAFPKTLAAALEDCAHVSMIVSDITLECEGKPVIVPGAEVTALWLDAGRIERSGDWQGARAWRARMPQEDGE